MTETTRPTRADLPAYEPAAIERKWQQRWDERGTNHTDLVNGARKFYALMMFPYPSAEGLHVGNLFAFTGKRHLRAIPPAAGAHGVRAARLRRLRHPLREFRPQGRNASGRADPAQHRELHPAAAAVGADDRLAPLAVDDGQVVLQVDAVDLSQALRARTGVQEGRGGQLVPERQDRARQRAGHRRRV